MTKRNASQKSTHSVAPTNSLGARPSTLGARPSSFDSRPNTLGPPGARASHVGGRASNFSQIFDSSRSAHAVFQRKTQIAEHRHSFGGPLMYDDEFTAAFLDHVAQEVDEDSSFRTRLRAWLAQHILHQRFETIIGVVILSNFVVIALETDARARRDTAAHGSSDRDYAEMMLQMITVAHLVYLVAYSMECAAKLYVLRMEFFKHKWNIFDFAIVATGLVTEIISIWQSHSSSFEDGLRAIRTIRILRATRVLVAFDELYALISGLTHAVKALMWAGLLMLMVLTVWSIIAVEYVKPLMPDIASKNGFGTCSWCASAFDNVFLSNLTFFQIISGDGWSHVARPLIEEHVWTVMLFVAVIFSMVFGLLNLIVAVIVDSAVQARESDIMTVAARKDAARAAAWDCFHDMVGELDKDGDGAISVDELRDGLMGDEEFGRLGAYLTTMGIEMTDLDMVFKLLDADGDGAVTHDEFTYKLYEMKTQELPITLCYVRSSVTQLQRELENVSNEIQQKLDRMLSAPAKSVVSDHVMPTHTTHSPPPILPPLCSSHEAPDKLSAPSSRRASIFQRGMDNTDTPCHARRGSLLIGKSPPTLRMPKFVDKSPRPSNLQGARPVGTPLTNLSTIGVSSNGSLNSKEDAEEIIFAGMPGFNTETDDRFCSLPGFPVHEHEHEHEEDDIR